MTDKPIPSTSKDVISELKKEHPEIKNLPPEGQAIVGQIVTQVFSGPLPPPTVLAQYKQIDPTIPARLLELVVLLGSFAGLRRGEIAALKWADVDYKNNQLYVAANKTENFRFVPLNEDLRKKLEIAQPTAKSEFVVEIGSTEARTSKDYLTTYYSHFTRKLPFRCHMHKLRHTFASQLVQNGVDLYTVSKLLGHSSIKMTEIYAHLSPRSLFDAVKLLPKL